MRPAELPPIARLAWGVVAVLLLIAAASQLPVPGVDRWLVFARAKNTVNLYYGRI